MRVCLYHEDYGPADPQFDMHANHDALLRGVEGSHWVLGQARNRDAFDAAKGLVQSGKDVAWCDQGYEWTETPTVEWGIFLLLVVLLPWRLHRLWRRIVVRDRAEELRVEPELPEQEAVGIEPLRQP